MFSGVHFKEHLLSCQACYTLRTQRKETAEDHCRSVPHAVDVRVSFLPAKLPLQMQYKWILNVSALQGGAALIQVAKKIRFRFLQNWCFWTLVLDKTLESPLDCKEIQPVNPKGNQSWIFIGRTDAEAETPIVWPPDAKNWLTGKDPDAEKDWRQKEKGTTEDEMVGWHHWLDGHEFEQAPGVGDGQGSLCCSPWGRRVRHDWVTELNWTEPYKQQLVTPRYHEEPLRIPKNTL